MLAVLNHRASAYEELHHVRTRLMGLRQSRSGLFITKGHNAFSCQAVISLLAEIAAVKFEALRILLSIDLFEKKLRAATHTRKAKNIQLGGAYTPDLLRPVLTRKHGMDNITTFLWTTLWLRNLPKPKI